MRNPVFIQRSRFPTESLGKGPPTPSTPRPTLRASTGRACRSRLRRGWQIVPRAPPGPGRAILSSAEGLGLKRRQLCPAPSCTETSAETAVGVGAFSARAGRDCLRVSAPSFLRASRKAGRADGPPPRPGGAGAPRTCSARHPNREGCSSPQASREKARGEGPSP